MTSSDAGATSSSITSPIVPSPIPTLSNAPSLTLSPTSTTNDKPIHRPFAGGLLSRDPRLYPQHGNAEITAMQEDDEDASLTDVLAARIRSFWRMEGHAVAVGLCQYMRQT